MKTLGLCLPKDRSEVMAPCPAAPEEFGSDSLANKDEDQMNNLLSTEDSVKGSLSNNSQESFKKFSLDSGLSNHFKSDNGLCNGFTNAYETTKDKILPTTKLKLTERLETAATAPSLSLNISRNSNDVQLSGINHTITKPFSSRYGKTCKRPSLEYLVARLHNRVEETKANVGCKKYTFPGSSLSSDVVNKTDDHSVQESSNFAETRGSLPSSSNLVEGTAVTLNPVKERDTEENESHGMKLIHKSDSADKSQILSNNPVACSTVAQSFSTDYLTCKDNVHSTSTTDFKHKDSTLENEPGHSDCTSSVISSSSHKVNKDPPSSHDDSDNKDTISIVNQNNALRLEDKQTCSESNLNIEASLSVEGTQSCKPNIATVLDKVDDEINCIKSKDSSNSRETPFNPSSSDVEDVDTLGMSTDREKVDSTEEFKREIPHLSSEASPTQTLPENEATLIETSDKMPVEIDCENTSSVVSFSKFVADSSENSLEKTNDTVRADPGKVVENFKEEKISENIKDEKIVENISHINDRSEEEVSKRPNECGLYARRNSSASTTPMFSDTPSDTSQSEMMVKISDAVAALLENTKGKSDESRNESYKDEVTDGTPNKLFSNSNTPPDGTKSAINFSSAFRILDLLHENLESKTSSLTCEPHDIGLETSEEKSSPEIKENYSSLSNEIPLSREIGGNSETIVKLASSSVVKDSPHSVGEEAASVNVERESGGSSVSNHIESSYSEEILNNSISKPCTIEVNDRLNDTSIANLKDVNTLSTDVEDEPINSEKTKLCSEDNTSILEMSCEEVHDPSVTSCPATPHSNYTEDQRSPLTQGFQEDTGEETQGTVCSANVNPEISELTELLHSNVDNLDISSSHIKKDMIAKDNSNEKDLIDNYDSEVEKNIPTILPTFEIITQKYIDQVLNKECNYYCSLSKMECFNFSYFHTPSSSISIDPAIDSLISPESNFSANLLSDLNESGVSNEQVENSKKEDSIEDVIDEQREETEKEMKVTVGANSPATTYPAEGARDQAFCVESQVIDCVQNSSELIEDSVSLTQGKLEDIGDETVVSEIKDEKIAEVKENELPDISLEKSLPETSEDDVFEPVLQESDSDSFNQLQESSCDTIQREKCSFLDFLKQERSYVAGECILCTSTFHTDLCWHASQVHTCISYIPIYQTDAFIHHMRERIGFVTHAYSDALYGNPLWICKCCSSIFKTMDSVRIHFNSHKEIYMIQSSSEMCLCNKSYFSFPLQKWRALLFRSKYVCSFCNYLFACQNGLANHLKVVHFHKKHCQLCKYDDIDLENDINLIEHNDQHASNKEHNLLFSYEENKEPERDQTHFSWNALDNHLNYLDGKVFRLDALKDLNRRPDRKYLSLPMTVDPSYATVPENMSLSPAPEMVTYIKYKLDSKLTGQEVDEYASKVLDLPVQKMLQKKFLQGRKKKGRFSLSKRTKFPLPFYLQLHSDSLNERKYISLGNQGDTSSHPTRCIYARKAKTKIQKKQSPKKQEVKVNEESVLKSSRTRSGIKPPVTSDNEEETDSITSPQTQNSPNEVSGEWVNYHTYVCCACGAVFLDLAEIMDHKWEAHPGVWCAHTMIHGREKVPKMFYQQYLPPHSKTSQVDYSSTDSRPTTKSRENVKEQFACSQCKMKFGTQEALHFHVIDCGGLNQIVINKKKNKKGIRFKRRKGQGVPSRRYAIHSLAPTPQKHFSDRGSGMSTPSKESAQQVTTVHSSNIVKRRLELAIGSIENSKLKSKLEAILSEHRTSPFESGYSRRRNLRRRLRKKKRLHQKRTRITRHSEANKENKKKANKEAKTTVKEPSDKTKIKKELHDPESSGPKKLVKGKKQQRTVDSSSEKEVKKAPPPKKKSSKDDEAEPVKLEAKPTKKASTILNIERKIKKLVPFVNKKEKKRALVKQTLSPPTDSPVTSNHNSDSKGSDDKRGLEKFKNALQSKNAPKFVRKVKNTLLKKRKRKGRVKNIPKKEIEAALPEAALPEVALPEVALPEVADVKNISVAKNKRTPVRTTVPDQDTQKGRRDESDSASEPEVIRNFRRKRLIGRTGLRTRKFQETRYSLRPSVNVAKDGDKVSDNTITQDDDDEEDVIVKPRRLSSRRYNIGDDDDDAAEEAKTQTQTPAPTEVKEEAPSHSLGNASKQKSKSLSRRNSRDSEELSKVDVQPPAKEDTEKSLLSTGRRKSLPSLKNPKSKINRFYQLAQRNLSRLRVNCHNTDSESSSGFEGFSSYAKRRRNAQLNKTSSLSSSETNVCVTSKPEVKGNATNHVLKTLSVDLQKTEAVDLDKSVKTGKRKPRLSRKSSSKSKKRKVVLTPEIVMSDSESDSSPAGELKTKEADAVNTEVKKTNQDEKTHENSSVSSEKTASEKPIPPLVPVHETKNKRKKASNGNCKRKRSKVVSTTNQNEVDKIKLDAGDSAHVPNSKDSQIVNDSSSIKNKLKPKRKYTFKKKLLNDSVSDTLSPKPKNKKILKEVSVLSYKSLNTRETPDQEKEEKEAISQELEKPKKKRPYKKRIRSSVDENSPTVAKTTRKYKKLKVSSPKISKREGQVEPESIGFLCIDCGLSFDSALSREDHRQDCRNIAFEMSLMAEDHLYECPYCQLTFALRGTQRKHIASCRMSRSRKYGSKRKRQSTTTGSQRSSVKASKNPRVPPPTGVEATFDLSTSVPSADGIHQHVEEGKETENTESASLVVEFDEREMELMGTRLASYCQEFVGVKEVCALMTQFKFCTNDLRCLLTTSTSPRDSTTLIRFDSANSSSQTSGSCQNSNYETLQNLLKQTPCIGLRLMFSDTLQTLFKKENLEDISEDLSTADLNSVTVDIPRPELLKALSSVEELLKEVSHFGSFLKKEQMLLAMKQTFQAGTGS